jgi:predicted nucleotidyltransferase component of viral defense system
MAWTRGRSMLTYDALIEQAKLRNMPPDKSRGILREYLQILLLKQLYRTDAGKHLYFTGGTYLRLVHGLKRFSEDLDFNSNKITEKEFENLGKKLVIELNRLGIKSEVSFSHWDHILVGRFNYPDIEPFYGIMARHTRKQGLLIKLEVNRPEWKVKAETEVIAGYGETYPCLSTDKSILFADKIDALMKKRMGRHLYDIIFMLSNKYSINTDILKDLGYTNNPFEIILDCVNDITDTVLKKQAEIIRPFLFDEQEAELIINAPSIIRNLIQKYT